MQMTFTGERYVPEMRGQIYYEHLHRYALALSLADGKDVLDVASGEGYGAAFLGVVARSVVGVDIDESSVAFAAAKYASMNVTFKRGAAFDLPLADACVDLVVSFETIEHLSEQELMLREIKRVLRPDGSLIMSSPNKRVYSDNRSYSNPFHVRELYFNEFRELLRAFFPEVRIFGQRIFAGSAVHPLSGVANGSRWLGPATMPESGISALADPEYFLAICNAATGSELPSLASVYLDPRDDLLADIRTEERTVGMLSVTNHATNGTTLQEPVALQSLTSGEPANADTASDGSGEQAETDSPSPSAVAAEPQPLEPAELQSQAGEPQLSLVEPGLNDEQLNARLIDLEHQNENLRVELEQTGQHAATLDAQASSTERLMESLRAELASLRERAARVSAELRREQSKTEVSARQYAALRTELEDARSLLETTLVERQAFERELQCSRERERTKTAELDAANAMLAGLIQSRSWKITLPLRLMGIAARGPRRNQRQ